MATRARTTFQKRQKEMARKDKQQRKAERREQRKLSRNVTDKFPPQDDTFPTETEPGMARVVSRHITVER
ncbi:MAG: hypothetical protein HYX73_02735 [Acidobacteria bacterium]|nr:hypothetical protein [Acidobacteriota bacterium]